MLRTAFLIDGGFFLKRYYRLIGPKTPEAVAKGLHDMCCRHLYPRQRNNSTPTEPATSKRRSELYRIFYYDCPPLSKKAHNPVTGRPIDFSKTSLYAWRLSFLDELKKLRKVALRLGYLDEGYWVLRGEPLKWLLDWNVDVGDLTESHVKYECKQKGVDMRIGLDIASLAYKKQVDQIVLVSGDSDFVPAAKLARREGIDFVLDPMWARIRDDLHEHIDGLRTVLNRPTPQGRVREPD